MISDKLTVENLGKLTLLQSMVALLPEEGTIIQFTCKGISELPGVNRVTWVSPEQFSANDTNHPSGLHELLVTYKERRFGIFTLELSDGEELVPYLPFLQNFVNMLGVIFEERRQRQLNERLNLELEERVLERTRQLEEKKENLKITLNSIGDGIIVTDECGKIRNLNPIAENLTGWKLSEAEGKPLEEVFKIKNSLSGLKAENPVEKALSLGKIVGLANHTSLVSKNGATYHIADSASPIRRPDGIISGAVLVFRDISDEYKLQEELRKSEKNYRRLIEGMGPRHCVFSHTIEGEFIFASQNFASLFGIPADEIIGRNWRELNLTKDSIEAGNEADRLVIETGKFQTVQITVIQPEGSQKIIEVYFGPVFEEGRIVKIEGICTDITEQKKAEITLQRSQKLEAIGTLAGGIAHDFNNLLGGIFGYIDLARTFSKDEKANEFLNQAMSTMDKAQALTQQLLTFSKGGAPNRTLQDLAPFLQESAMFAISGSNVACHFDIQPGLWLCEYDKGQIAQVIDHVVNNARQAMKTGGTIEVIARNLRLEENNHKVLSPGPYVQISFKDHGHGICPTIVSRVFDPFFTTRNLGQGLGLAVCFSIIKRHKGFIEVESEPEQGTTVHVFLPAKPDAKKESAKAENTTSPVFGTILLMDDESIILDTVSQMLSALGYQVICTPEGHETLSAFQNLKDAGKKVAAIILDLTVPNGLGGLDTVAKLRELDADVPIFVSSGYAEDPVMAAPHRHGFSGSICKPFSLKEISRLLQAHLS